MSPTAFTCITCQVAFADADLQRSHYKNDWHRYNLKRKVAGLPPVTAEGFHQRQLAQQAEATVQNNKSTSFYCEPCGKKICNEAAFKNHNSSAKHKERLLQMAEQQAIKQQKGDEDKSQSQNEQMEINEKSENNPSESQDEEMEEWDDDQLGVEECLFCSFISKSLKSNVKHMTNVHNFFIPDLEFLVDLEGFITHLGEKVSQGKMCLWCNDRSKVFQTIKATQQHMTDKGHCMLLYEGDAVFEYADYYDYTKSYPDNENADPQSVVALNVLEADDNYELTLPSGNKIGHRTLARYYKQNLVSRLNPEGRTALSKILSHYKALGWCGATGQVAERRIKDLQYVQRLKQRHHMALGVKSNRTSQMHYRRDVAF